VRLSYIEQFERVSLDFMIKDLTTSPIQDNEFVQSVMDDIRALSKEIIKEPTKLGFRIKIFMN
jgi:hypothetical protein